MSYGYNYDPKLDFEITKREILISVCIVVFFIISGMFIAGKINDRVMDNNEVYNKAVKIEDSELFQYGMNTNVGNAFVYGTLEAVDTVTFPEIGGEYMYVEKVKERYTKHTRVVTYTDSDGNTRTKTETYWSWDEVDRERKYCNQIKFSNVVFDFGKIDCPTAGHIETVKESYYIRYKYYGTPTMFKGTIFTDLRDGTISDGTDFYKNMNLDEAHEMMVSDSGLFVGMFWALWIILMIISVYGFYRLENRWLE